jgi:hypothetical protein
MTDLRRFSPAAARNKFAISEVLMYVKVNLQISERFVIQKTYIAPVFQKRELLATVVAVGSSPN